MTKKQGIRAVLFLVVTCAVLLWIDGALRLPKDQYNVLMTRRFEEMYRDERDTWDGIIVGTSEADRAWAAPLAWEEQGMAVYPMSTDGNPFVLTSNIIEEVLKYQDLSFVAVELHGARPESLSTNDIKIHRVTDHMKRSANRNDAIAKAIRYMDEWYADQPRMADSLRAGLYFPLIKYHSRLTKEKLYPGDLDHGETRMKGVYEAPQHIKTNAITLEANDRASELLAQQKMLLDEVIACAKKHDLQLVFLKGPTAVPVEQQESMNAMVQYVEQQGYPALNFNDAEVLEACGLDGQTDFFDDEHLNAKGARIYTHYVAAWMKEALELPDHRGDKRYASWDDAAKVYEDFYETSLTEIAAWKKKRDARR